MKDSMNSSLPSQMDASDALTRHALDLSWMWNHSTDQIWRRLPIRSFYISETEAIGKAPSAVAGPIRQQP